MTIVDRFYEILRKQPDRALLICDETLTYAEMSRRIVSLANGLRQAGLLPGSKVGLFFEDYVSFFTAMLACFLNGNICLPLNVKLKSEVLNTFLQQTDTSTVLASVPGNLNARYLDIHQIGQCKDEYVFPPSNTDDVAIIMFTSGSTGEPKAVPQTFEAITLNALETAERINVLPKDRIFINTPPYYTSAICHFLTMLVRGASVAGSLGFFFGTTLLDEMKQMKCTAFGGAPTHLIRVIGPLSEPLRNHGLRFWVSSGDALQPEMMRKFLRTLPGVTLHYMFGLTEVSGRLCCHSIDSEENKLGSVGKPLRGMNVAIVNDRGEAVASGVTGEVCVKGPMLMKGYLGSSESNRKSFSPKGFLTGDLGWLDNDGDLWLVGRKDDIVKIGGEKVSLVQIRFALQHLGYFEDCAVVADDDPFMGHLVIAFAKPKPNLDLKPRKILKMLKSVLPAPSIPGKLLYVDDIPRTGSGKVKKLELEKMIERK